MDRSEINWPIISWIHLEELLECPICKNTNTCRITRSRLFIICEFVPMGCVSSAQDGSKTVYMHAEDVLYILYKLKIDGESL